MKLKYEDISEANANVLHSLMTEYYREAEDRDTPQEEIDEFITLLCDLLAARYISGRLVYGYGDKTVGFLLWMIDRSDSQFSEMPGYGTILEIGLASRYRQRGFGKSLVDYAEAQMADDRVTDYYVLAYGPARNFWRRCGYSDSHKKGKNGLPLLIKSIS